MENDTLPCPKCQSPYGYPDGSLWVCPECFHEWSTEALQEETTTFRDSVGNILADGDDVTVIKDLKAGKGTIKSGTKAKGIKLLDEPVNGHDISCKIPGHGSIYLKCSVVKKA